MQWSALNKAGIDRNTKVTLALKNISYHKILTLLLASIPGAPGQPLAYQLQDGIVVVSTQAVFDGRRQFIAYDLGAHLAVFFNHNIPAAQREQEATDLTALIKQDIAPTHWKAGENQINNFHGSLIVSAPVDIQLQIAQLLADLQKSVKPPKAPGILVQSANRATVSKALDKPFAAESIAGTLQDAIKQIQDAAGICIYTDWQKLTAAGITPDRRTVINPKAGSMQGKPMGYVLQQTLMGVADKWGVLDFAIDDEGVVVISTAADVAEQTAVTAYDLRDWIKRQQFRAIDPKPTAEELVNPVIDALTKAVAPDTWGKTAYIQPFQGLLVVSATPKHHRAILEQLTKLVKQ